MLLIGAAGRTALAALFARWDLRVSTVAGGRSIPGSYWGEREAGLIGSTLYVRADTPLHSALHEGSHFVCMGTERRARLHTDAGGDDAEENAVCYLQILLAALLPGVGQARMCRDMDDWGYTFRLGSAAAWFERDAADARNWLLHSRLIDAADRVMYACR